MPDDMPVSTILRDQVGAVNNTLLNTLKITAEIAAKGPVVLMLSLGSALIMIGLLFKVDLRGFHLANLSLGDFIAILSFGFLLIVGGAGIRVYQFYASSVSVIREQQKLGADLLKRTADAATELMKHKPESVIL
jgi:hypothetical protein